MKRIKRLIWRPVVAVLLTACIALGCSASNPGTGETDPHDHDEHDEQQSEHEGGIAVPPNVRDNLGITFVKVERRTITSTRRVPGMFELRPAATHEYRALLSGRISLHVAQFETVETGDLLLTINSPKWREIQHAAVEAEGEITMAEANRDVVRARHAEAKALLEKAEERTRNLESAGARNAELETEATALRNSLPRIEAELAASEAAVREAHEHYESRLRALSSVTGIPIESLLHDEDGEAAWRAITELEVRAEGSGVVQTLEVNKGGWLEEGELALTTVDPTAIRFHAEAPQSDIGMYRDGQRARIVPAQGGSVDLQSGMDGVIRLGLTAHPTERTLSLFVEPSGEPPAWARAGVSAFLEVTLTENAQEHWAIPKSAVVQDGLEHIFYRRDPDNPDRVLRVVADLGESDGRWVAVKSRVMKGDEVVLDGAYALTLSNSGQQAPEGYHYHADGTLHKDE